LPYRVPHANLHIMATDPTTAPAQQAHEIALNLWSQGHTFSMALLRPWNAYQIGINLALILAANILRAVLGPRLHAWLRTREG